MNLVGSLGPSAGTIFLTNSLLLREETMMTATLTTLVSFNGPNGATPYGTLIADANGDLFGTTAFGRASGWGTVFELAKSGSTCILNTLVSFSNGAPRDPARRDRDVCVRDGWRRNGDTACRARA
jgi:hypothetical protein